MPNVGNRKVVAVHHFSNPLDLTSGEWNSHAALISRDCLLDTTAPPLFFIYRSFKVGPAPPTHQAKTHSNLMRK